MAHGRTLVVGDIHGCLQELDALLDRTGFRPGVDALVSVGDVVAKGPDSVGVIRRLREVSARAVRGNHDHRVLGGTAPRKGSGRGRGNGHAAVAASLTEDDRAWLAALPFSLLLPDVGALVVHAGLVPGIPIAAQDPEHLMTMRSLRRDGRPSSRLGDGDPWATRWTGPELVVFGHDAVSGLQIRPHAIGLDTGCVYGGRLTAVWLPDRRIVSVPAGGRYAPAG